MDPSQCSCGTQYLSVRALFWGALSYGLVLASGCGSNSPSVTSTSANPEASATEGGTATNAPQTPNAVQEEIKIAAPTKQQLERWTAETFDPLRLLAVREWEKTSFASRLASLPDGKQFLVAGSRVLLWSIDKNEPEHVFLDVAPDDNDRAVLSLAVAPDGKWFAAGDSNGTVRVWNVEDRKEIVNKKLGPTGIQWLAISPDGHEIATVSYTSDVTTWNPTTLEQLQKFKVNTSGVKRIEYAAPKMLAVAGESTSLWNTGDGKMMQELTPGRYSFALARSPDGSRFIFGGNDSLRIWNVAESKQVAEINKGVSGSERVAFSEDGKWLATTNGRSLQLWNLADLRTVQVIDSFGWPIVDICWLPKTNLLLVASEIGMMRIWGTASQGSAAELKPLHSPLALPSAGSDEPASLAQMEQLIDLRTFPRLPDSEPSVVQPDSFQCVVPVKSDEAYSFYKYFLEKEGWQPAKSKSLQPGIEFQKDGFTVSVYCSDSGDGKTFVMLNNRGNFDVRRLPKFDAAPVESIVDAPMMVSFKTKAHLTQIETTLLRKLHSAGWTGYSRLKSSHGEQPDARDLNFLRNGVTLRVSIGKSPAAPDQYTVQYSLFSNNAAVPVPHDSGFVEFDGSTEATLVAVTKQSLEQLRAFYDKELTAQGWLVRASGQSDEKDQVWLSYLRNQSDLTISLTKLPDGNTLVRVGKTGESLWDLSQKKEEDGSEKNAGLEAAEFPVLNGTAAFDANDKSIEITIAKSTLAMAAEHFTQALDMLGWKVEDGGIRAEDYTLLRFKSGKKEITLRARPKDGNAVVNFQGDGLLWKKPLPTAKQAVSYEMWLRQNKLPPSLEFLDRYEKEMNAISAPKS